MIGHEYFTAEHLLFSLLSDSSVRRLLRKIGGRDECMRKDLVAYFKRDYLKHKANEAISEIKPSISIHRVVERAIGFSQEFSEDKFLSVLLILAIFDEKDSFAFKWDEVFHGNFLSVK